MLTSLFLRFIVFLLDQLLAVKSYSARIFKYLKHERNIKIYDCFTFFDNLEILDLRLNVLKEIADVFVLVESDRDHSGKEKNLYYNEKKCFFEDQIATLKHIVVDNMPALSEVSSRHDLTKFQRNQIHRGLTDCRPDDIVIISDVDEIPNPSKVKVASIILTYVPFIKAISLQQGQFYYYLNGKKYPEYWNKGTVACTYKSFLSIYDGQADQVRPSLIDKRRRRLPYLKNAGWHFSYLGGAERISQKIYACEAEHISTPHYANKERIATKLENGEDLFDRKNSYVTYVKLDKSFPDYLLKNMHKYQSIIKTL